MQSLAPILIKQLNHLIKFLRITTNFQGSVLGRLEVNFAESLALHKHDWTPLVQVKLTSMRNDTYLNSLLFDS